MGLGLARVPVRGASFWYNGGTQDCSNAIKIILKVKRNVGDALVVTVVKFGKTELEELKMARFNDLCVEIAIVGLVNRQFCQ